MKHGYSTYTNHGCRCEECRLANRLRMRDRRAKAKANPAAPPVIRLEQRWTVEDQYLADLLRELFPDGLTDDCPVRRGQQQALA